MWTVENHRNSSVDANRPMRFRRQKRVPLKNAFVFPIPRRRVIRIIIDISPLKLTYANRSNADGLHNPIQSFAAQTFSRHWQTATYTWIVTRKTWARNTYMLCWSAEKHGFELQRIKSTKRKPVSTTDNRIIKINVRWRKFYLREPHLTGATEKFRLNALKSL